MLPRVVVEPTCFEYMGLHKRSESSLTLHSVVAVFVNFTVMASYNVISFALSTVATAYNARVTLCVLFLALDPQ